MSRNNKIIEFDTPERKIILPFIEIIGKNGDGPTALITAGIHGCEYPGIAALMDLASQIDDNELRGRLQFVTIANLESFEQRTMFKCPVDNKNPNRVFPGNAEGTFTDRLVFSLMKIIGEADCYLDLHSGDMVEELSPFALYHRGDNSEIEATALAMAKAYGLPNIATSTTEGQWPDEGTTYANAANTFNIPALIVEAGGVGQLEEKYVEMHKNGILNVFKLMGNINGVPQMRVDCDYFSDMAWIYTTEKGFFRNKINVGSEISQNEYMGTLYNYFGEEIEKIYAPTSGKILFKTTSPAISRNGLIAGIGIRDRSAE